MGPRSENRGYLVNPPIPIDKTSASMGPRSENRGYRSSPMRARVTRRGFNGSTVGEPWLSVVSKDYRGAGGIASMGPRSENRGYQPIVIGLEPSCLTLQWVHGRRTVVIEDKPAKAKNGK